MEHTKNLNMDSTSTLLGVIISWILTGFATLFHYETQGTLFASVFLQMPFETDYEFMVRVVKDVLTILCFIAAFVASIYAIAEKRMNMRLSKKTKKKW